VTGRVDLLDRLFEHLRTAGSAAPLAELAPAWLHTENTPLALRVMEALVAADPRFVLREGRLSLAPLAGPPAGLTLDALAFAVVDFETNGLAPQDRAIEIGVIVVEGGRETASFESLLDPGTPIAPFVQQLTGIRPEDLRGQPTFPQVWPRIEPLLAGRVLVAHNLPFDRRILRHEVSLLGGDRRAGHAGLCTVRLSRKLHPTEESHCLDAVAGRYGLTFEARHRALDDARVTARLLLRLLDEAAERLEAPTWEALCDWLAPKARPRKARPPGAPVSRPPPDAPR